MRTRIVALLLPLLFALPASADVLTRTDGRVLEGRINLERREARIQTSRGLVRVPYEEVSRLRFVPEAPRPPVTDEERAAVAGELASRLDAATTPDALADLAQWCFARGLDAEARDALDRAVLADPEHALARELREEIREEGGWRAADEIVTERLAAAENDPDRIFAISRWAEQHDFPRARDRALRAALAIDAFHERSVAAMFEITDPYVSRTDMTFPLRGNWQASEDPTHHHRLKKFALHALDFVRVDDEGATHRGSGRALEDFYSWDQPVYAVAPGRVMVVHGDFPDNPVGQIAPWQNANLIAILHDTGEYSLYVHLRQGSATVAEGATVERGQVIGRIGNSGASAVPHLHFALNDRDAISLPFWFRDYNLVVEGRPIPVDFGRPCEGQEFLIPEE